MLTAFYTGTSDTNVLEEAANCGAEGFVLKSAPPNELIAAIETVAAGGTFVDETRGPGAVPIVPKRVR